MNKALWVLIGIFALAGRLEAESTSYTPPSGYVLLNIQGESDNHVSLPLGQRANAFGRIASVEPDRVVVGAKVWEPGQFRASASGPAEAQYYAEFASGALKGVRYRVLDNSDDTLLLETHGDDLTAHPLGALAFNDTVRLRPLWTVEKIFGSSESEIVLEPETHGLIPGDAVILPNNMDIGQNKTPEVEISFVHEIGWRARGDLDTDQQHRPFEPGSPLTVRRQSAEETSVALVGYVLSSPQVVYVGGGDGEEGNDFYVSVLFPEPVSLDAAGLAAPGNAPGSVIRSSHSIFIREDELLSFGSNPGFNLAPERSFFFLEGAGWREVGTDSTTVGADFFLEPGRAYIIRKRPLHPGVDWTQTKGN